ncbi:MAG TPA: HIT family protein [Candidatus Saccharimonadales bacterium]
MNSECIFCAGMAANKPEFFLGGSSDLFAVQWDMFPTRPGHALVMPRRHVQYFRDLTEEELREIARVVVEVKAHIMKTDLAQLYKTLLPNAVNEKSQDFIRSAQALLAEMDNRPPDAFNDGMNDGPAAGQTVPHVHWHIMPRWTGDVEDPRGGIRHMFPGLGNYHKGVEK